MRLSGKNPAIERLRANPSSVKQIYVEEGAQGVGYIHKRAQQNGIPVFVVPKSKIQKMARNTNTQGVLVDISDFEYVPYDELLDRAAKGKRSLLFLDGITDPQNFGAVLRSLACLGRFSIVLPRKESVSVTETVLRVASGGENYVPVAHVSNLGNAVKAAKEAGFQIAGAVVGSGEDLSSVKFGPRVGVVVGSEQKGIREIIRRELDLQITIPMAIETLSFNVAQAATILCYEITRQKKNRADKEE